MGQLKEMIEQISSEKDFDAFVVELDKANLSHDVDYELYNEAFEKLYGHSAFDSENKE